MTAHWYVLRSKPHKEGFLHEQLCSRKIESYFPVLRVKPVNPRSRKLRPLFPGYLFIHIDLNESERSFLEWMPGSVGLVSFDGIPSEVPDAVVNSIRNQVDVLNNTERKSHEFKKGDRVILQDGPFAGYKAIFDMNLSGEERVMILLELIENRNIRLSLSPKQIKKVK